jgi:hypothetical protein
VPLMQASARLLEERLLEVATERTRSGVEGGVDALRAEASHAAALLAKVAAG